MAQINLADSFPPYLGFLFNFPLTWSTAIGILIASIIFYVLFWFFNKYLEILGMHKGKYSYLEIKPTDRTLKTPLSTNQLFTVLHSIVKTVSSGWFTTHKKNISFEIVSTKEQGIRFILRVPTEDESIIYKNLLAYLPGIEIKTVEDYLMIKLLCLEETEHLLTQELKLKKSFLYPLQEQELLAQYDPIAYITAHMTKLEDKELVATQFICTPISYSINSKIIGLIKEIENRLLNNMDIADLIRKSSTPLIIRIFQWSLTLLTSFMLFVVLSPVYIIAWITTNNNRADSLPWWVFEKSKRKNINELGVQKQTQYQTVYSKISQPLFETTVRSIATSEHKIRAGERLRGMFSAFETLNTSYQKIKSKKPLFSFTNYPPIKKIYYSELKDRLSYFGTKPILSVNELSSLYHLPYTSTTKTEDISKIHYKQLPAPLSLKQTQELDIAFAKNTYGGLNTKIGITKVERTGHMYVIGQTRSGKSNMILQMIIQDIQAGRGVAVIDPHGDLAKSLINFIPEERINDFVYVNPYDFKYPVGINLLQLTNNVDEDDAELEEDIVTESAISILRKVFSNEFSKGGSSAFRIESLLRNTIHTAFLTETPTLFTIFDILNNKEFRTQALQKITDPRLMDFWREEFGTAGDYQRVKMIAPINARVGRFLFSPITKRILEQKKSTVDFDDVLNKEKVLICNLAKGEISEDNCEVLGTLIITKIRQAAEKRAHMDYKERKPFYLYVDEFQNFATPSFVKMLSELGKFGINIIIVEQSTSQQLDRSLTNIILANSGNVITFKTANPIDEDLMMAQFSPYVEKGDIPNLPRYHFYMKKGAVEPEEPFSGETEPVDMKIDKNKVERFIQASRDNYAIAYKRPKAVLVTDPKSPEISKDPSKKEAQNTENSVVKDPAYLT